MSTATRPFGPLFNRAAAWLPVILALALASVARADHDDSDAADYRPDAEYDATVEPAWLSAGELEDLAGPVALYPDDLLAIVLPASAYPLQIVQAARFLEALETDTSLKPDERWDESVVALLNYPDIVTMMNADIEWTWALGEAVVAQESELIEAIERFREKAYEAGNLETDDRQVVAYEDERITITPVEEDVIYVPYYEPRRVIVYQREPAYFYHPYRYPVYYYPYRTRHSFHHGRYFGVSSLYHIGWSTRSLHVRFHHYPSHPYFGRSYLTSFYYHHHYQPRRYRHRALSSGRGYHASRHDDVRRDRGYRGDRWRPGPRHGARPRVHDERRADQRRGLRADRSGALRGGRDAQPRRDGDGRRGVVRPRGPRATSASTPAVRPRQPRTTTAATTAVQPDRSTRDARRAARRGEGTRQTYGVRRGTEQRATLTEPRARDAAPARTDRSPRRATDTRRVVRRDGAAAREVTTRSAAANPVRRTARVETRARPPSRAARAGETRRETRRTEAPRRAAVRTETPRRAARRSEPRREATRAETTRPAQRSEPQSKESRSERKAPGKERSAERRKASKSSARRADARRERGR